MYRRINDFKRDYQPTTNTVRDEKGDLFTDSHSILARWRDHFSQLLNIYGVNDIRQTEIHTAEPLVHEPSAFEVELTIENLTSHESRDVKQIPAEMIKTGCRTIPYEIHKHLFLFGIRRNCLSRGRSLSLYLSTRAIKQIVVITEAYHFRQLRTKCYPTSCCQG